MRDGGDGGRHPGRHLLNGGGLFGADGDDELAESVGVLVGSAAGEGLIEHHAQGPDVGAAVEVAVAARLLGRHVERRAEHAPGAGEARRLGPALAGIVDDLGDTEVEELDDTLAAAGGMGAPPIGTDLREEEVGGLDVAVDDVRLVRAIEAEEAWAAMRRASSGGRGPRRLMRCCTSSPSRNSSTRKGSSAPPSMPASSTLTMCGVSMVAAARASRSKRPIRVGFFAVSAVMSLTATRAEVTELTAS